jgi:hypothetical protein
VVSHVPFHRDFHITDWFDLESLQTLNGPSEGRENAAQKGKVFQLLLVFTAECVRSLETLLFLFRHLGHHWSTAAR